jgi:DNA-binding NarL/FixJ family response regulator
MQSQRQEARLSTLPLPRAMTNGMFYAVAPESGDLSDREVEVLRLVAEGLSNKEIADALHISTHTVARHVTNIMRKLDAANRAQAATMAFRRGLLAL